jgi:RNA polymerase sigma-70 factor (ECF subfamily)
MSEPRRPDPDSDAFTKPDSGIGDVPTDGPAQSTAWRELFEQVEPGLRAFLRHRLRQESDIDDCLQVVFVKWVESAEKVAPAARKAWLFRVAVNEASRMWRSEASTNRMLQQRGWDQGEQVTVDVADPIDQVIRSETSQQLEDALMQLPASWQEVIRLRIHQNLTFQQIADQLEIPLGTALTRMRRAMERLRREMDQDTK